MSGASIIVDSRASRERAMRAVFTLALDKGKPWVVKIEPETRRLRQNNLYHEWVGRLARHTGHGHDELHEWLKVQFLPPSFTEVRLPGKEPAIVEWRPSTTKLTIADMAEYMERVRALAAEMGLQLTTLEEQSLTRSAA